jgi:hypothetical protein
MVWGRVLVLSALSFCPPAQARFAPQSSPTLARGFFCSQRFASALAAIEATLADDREAEHRPDGKGAYFVTLPRDVLDKLNYLRAPGESYSDLIIRVARG